MKEFIFTWRIENFSYSWHKTGYKIRSPTCATGLLENSLWILELYPTGDSVSDYLSLYLRRCLDEGPPDLAINFEFCCLTQAGNPYAIKKFFKYFEKGEAFGHSRFMGRHEVCFQKKALFLPQDILTLRCRLWIDNGNEKECRQNFGRTQLVTHKNEAAVEIGPYRRENFIPIHSTFQNKEILRIQATYLKGKVLININPINVDHLKFSTLKLKLVNKTNKNMMKEHTSAWTGPPRLEMWRMAVPKNEDTTIDVDPTENNTELTCEFVYSTGEVIANLEKTENECPHLSRSSELISKYTLSCIPSGDLSDYPRVTLDLWNLYGEHAFWDVEFKTQTTSFFIHKAVLCARSPVFLAMLTGQWRENRNRRVEIVEIADDILDKFIQFLYTDTFEDLEWEIVIGLYYVADKYLVERLKILCSYFLLKNVDINNALELFKLADRHQDLVLRNRVQHFILQNDQRIFRSSIWKKFVDEHPGLVATLMLFKRGRFKKEKGKKESTAVWDNKLLRQPDVKDDLKALYIGKVANDIFIKTTSATFPSHKAVLFAGSSFLKKMFTRDFRDKYTKVFEIQDLEDDTVSRMLLFLYSDSLEDLEWDVAVKLYRAAVMYQIERLKMKSACFLLENVNKSNASDLLLLAHQNHDAKLKPVVEDFIFMHSNEIFGSDQWAEFSEENSRLANETMRSFFRK